MWEQIASNRRRSALLVVVMAALLGALGWALAESQVEGGGPFGVAFAAAVWLVLTLVAWLQGDRIYLAMSGVRCRRAANCCQSSSKRRESASTSVAPARLADSGAASTSCRNQP